MRKMKMGAVLLIALCLLVLFAFLPGIAAKITDISQKNRAGSSDITPISLNLSPENGQLSIVEKMHLLKSGNSYPIGESEAKATASEALGWVESLISQYTEGNEFPWFEVPHYQVLPSLCIDEENPERHCVFWVIYIVNEGEYAQSLTVVADDETGTVIGVDYTSAGVEERNDITYANILDSLCELYLGQLGVSSVEENTEIAPTEDGHWEPDISYAQRQITLRDSEGHRIIVVLTADSNGSFYTSFIE